MNKVKVVALALFVFLVVFGARQLSALFVLNHGHVPYLTNPAGSNGPAARIENSIVDGASSFLKGHAEILMVLNQIELANTAGLDFIELQKNLDTAIMHMENARIAYLELKTSAGESTYNQAVIKNLIKFNYKGFQNANQLNPHIFEKLVKYLNRGDVRGVFNQFYLEIGTILSQLHEIKAAVAARTIPELAKFWRLNQRVSDTQLFGQYAAEVFMTLEN